MNQVFLRSLPLHAYSHLQRHHRHLTTMRYHCARQPVVVEPRRGHNATVLMLHGLGDVGQSWSVVASPQYWTKSLPHVKFIFPTAAVRRIAMYQGERSTAWFDVVSLRAGDQQEDEKGIEHSYNYIMSLLQAEIDSGIPASRIVIIGYSQGGSLALYCLRSNTKFGAIVGMSTFLSLRDKKPLVSEANRTTPVLLCHGTEDTTVVYQHGQDSYRLLKDEVEKIEFKSYEMGHTASVEELNDVQSFLESILG